MSLRPRLPGAARAQIARTRMAPGGQAKPYSQSPLRLSAGINRLRSVGLPPSLAVPTCSNTSYVLTSATASSAVYVVDPVVAGEVPFRKRDFGVYVNGTLTVPGPVLVWATAIDADEALSVPTGTVILTGGPGYDSANDYIYITDQFAVGEVRGWTLEWDTPGAFSTLCCYAVYAE